MKLYDETKNVGGNGVFVQTVKVLDLLKPEDNGGFQKQINYIVKLEITKDDGDTFERKMFIGGNPTKADTLPKNLSKLMEALGIMEDENADNILDAFGKGEDAEIVKNFFKGKMLKTLSFVSGTYSKDGSTKPSYKYWNGMSDKKFFNPWSIDTDDEVILEAFMEEVNKKTKYSPKYTPEVLLMEDTDEPQTDSETLEEDMI